MTEQNASTIAVASVRNSPGLSKAILGPLTVRDITVLGAVLVIFVASVLPIAFSYGFSLNLWSAAGLYFIGIGAILPISVGVLFAIRRLNPEMKIRVGSLSADQYASVVASFATAYFFLATVSSFKLAYLVGLIGSLALLLGTVLAQWIPFFASDFAGRAEVPAHPAARDAVPALARPTAPKQPLALTAGAPAAQGVAGQPGQQAQGQYGQPSHGQPGPGWNTSAPASKQAPGGQIFTPAGSTPAPNVAKTARTAAAGVIGATGVMGQIDGPESSAATAAATAAALDSQAAQAPQAVAAPEPATAVVEEKAQADADVVPSAQADAPATTLNPQVNEQPAESKPAESIGATVDPAAGQASVVAEPFWFAVDRPQNVVDERTRKFVFKLIPGAWILALEDRGDSFLVQDNHGKSGVLLDLVGIERAPESN